MNIGLHGRQSYLEFHEPQSLRDLVEYAQKHYPNLSPATYIVSTLNDYLDRQREVVLGPDSIRPPQCHAVGIKVS